MLQPVSNRTLMSLAVAGACAALAAPADAQQTTSRNANGVQVVEVTAFRASAEDALNIKRNDDGFVDAISSDGLDRFPDLNVGEALARIPGIQINREAGNRDATVNLRGLPSTFATITINGQVFADPAPQGGGVPLGVFSSDAFSRMVVNKSPSAADASGGLSGNIDLQTTGALARKDGGSYKLFGEYNSLGKSKTPGANVSITRHLNPDLAVFGMLTYKKEDFRRDDLRVNSFQQLNLGNATFVRSTAVPAAGGNPALPAVGTGGAAVTNLADFADYYAAPGDTTPGAVILNVPGANTLDGKPIVGTGKLSKTGVLFGKEIRQVINETKGNSFTTAGGFEMKVNSDLRVGAMLFAARRDLSGTDTYVLNSQTGQGNTLVTADPSSVFVANTGQAYLNSYSFVNGFQLGSGRNQAVLQETGGLSGSINWTHGDWRARTTAVISRARGDFDGYNVDLQRNPGAVDPATPNGNGTYGAVNLGMGDYTKITHSLQGTPWAPPAGNITLKPDPATRPPGTWNSLSYTQIAGSAVPSNWLQFSEFAQGTRNRVNAFQQDLERALDDLPVSSVKGGLRYEQNKFKSIANLGASIGSRVSGLTTGLITRPDQVGSYAGGEVQTNDVWVTGNVPYAKANLTATDASLADKNNPLNIPGFPITRTAFGLVTDLNNSNNYLFNYENNYAVKSAYLLANIDTSVFGMRLKGNVGVRRDQLDKTLLFTQRIATTSGTGNNTVVTIRNPLTRFDSTYSKNLPSMLLGLDLTKDLVLRYGAYETYVKPQRRDDNPVTSASVSQGTQTVYTINLGNNLKPYTAFSQDLGLEWYNRKGSVVAVNVYQKNVRGLTYAINKQNAPDLACPASGIINGVDYGFGALQAYDAATNTCRAVNRDASNPQNGQPADVLVNVSGVLNNPNLVRVRGWEFTAQQNLSFLPYPWSNFGGQVNYSYTKVRGTYPNGTPVIIDGVSNGATNLIVYYETPVWGVRAILNDRDKYDLLGASTFNGGARTAKERRQLDLSASYKLTPTLSAAIDVYNLNNAIREEYDQDERVFRAAQFDGRTVTLSLRGSF